MYNILKIFKSFIGTRNWCCFTSVISCIFQKTKGCYYRGKCHTRHFDIRPMCLQIFLFAILTKLLLVVLASLKQNCPANHLVYLVFELVFSLFLPIKEWKRANIFSFNTFVFTLKYYKPFPSVMCYFEKVRRYHSYSSYFQWLRVCLYGGWIFVECWGKLKD